MQKPGDRNRCAPKDSSIDLGRALGVAEILLRLDAMFDLLVGGTRGVPDRQQTLRATLDWSHALLTFSEQIVFRRLAVFAGEWSMPAVEEICTGGEVSRPDVLPLVAHLVDASLVIQREQEGHARYVLLEPVRAFALEHLAATGETAAFMAAHAKYFFGRALDLTIGSDCTPSDVLTRASRLDRIAQDYDNLRMALRWFVDNGPTETALRFANALAELWQYRGQLTQGRTWMSVLLSQPTGEAGTRARALGWAGNFAYFQGDPLAARAVHMEALALDRATGDEAHAARVLGALARDALALGDYRTAEQLGDEALRVSRALGINVEELWTLYTLGAVAYDQGAWEAALALYSACLERTGKLGGAPPMTAMAQYGLARVAHQQGDYARACALHEQAIATQRALDDRAAMAVTLVGLGQVLLDMHNTRAARAAFEESLVLHEAVGDRTGLARSFDALAGLAILEDDLGRACCLAGAAESLRAEGQTPLTPTERNDLARRLEPARQLAGSETVTALMATGRVLPLAAAITLARTGASQPVAQKPLGTTTGSESARPDTVPGPGGRAGGRTFVSAEPGFRRTAAAEGAARLTAREREVAALLGQGLNNRQIAERLVITHRTARAHVEHIFDKLGFTSRTQVGIWAAEQGLLAGAY